MNDNVLVAGVLVLLLHVNVRNRRPGRLVRHGDVIDSLAARADEHLPGRLPLERLERTAEAHVLVERMVDTADRVPGGVVCEVQ